MVMEYKTMVVSGWPDRLVNAAAVEGWRVLAVTSGGYDQLGAYQLRANTIWLEREHQSPIAPEAEGINRAAVTITPVAPRKRGRPPRLDCK